MPRRRIPILGKHSKAIICGMWTSDNLLALGSEDKTISISNIEGDTLKTISLQGEPSMMAFTELKLDERSHGENTVRVALLNTLIRLLLRKIEKGLKCVIVRVTRILLEFDC